MFGNNLDVLGQDPQPHGGGYAKAADGGLYIIKADGGNGVTSQNSSATASAHGSGLMASPSS